MEAIFEMDTHELKISNQVYNLMNMRQFHIFSIKPELDIRLFVDFFVFTCFYWCLHDVHIRLFCRLQQQNFKSTLGINWLKTGKFTEINK